MGRDKAKSMGMDKAKAKGKAMSSSDYESKKLSLVEELAETNRVKKQAIEQFDQKIDKLSPNCPSRPPSTLSPFSL
ncbi:hypothetical protein L1987_86018 [Smallanthus sonchifolius]|uniref:Uncharacterized protein n=1 Tax=Smallanthus sonchifolius TaxID=185202 RepID=A0ACB8XYC1_9ASTR|nr:hypothetical protein L1987_86018 [Smallanthus sonchifolius]